jgi:hypothetical protein
MTESLDEDLQRQKVEELEGRPKEAKRILKEGIVAGGRKV